MYKKGVVIIVPGVYCIESDDDTKRSEWKKNERVRINFFPIEPSCPLVDSSVNRFKGQGKSESGFRVSPVDI